MSLWCIGKCYIQLRCQAMLQDSRDIIQHAIVSNIVSCHTHTHHMPVYPSPNYSITSDQIISNQIISASFHIMSYHLRSYHMLVCAVVLLFSCFPLSSLFLFYSNYCVLLHAFCLGSGFESGGSWKCFPVHTQASMPLTGFGNSFRAK